MAILNYSVFIDVLGYGAIVTDPTKTIDQKINILNSIYSSLASALLITINEINNAIEDKIYIKSFSDSFYMESTNLLALLYSSSRIFNDTFGFYSGMPKDSEYTPLIRGGLVKGWTVRFSDLGALVNNNEETNPVGLGVARAYWTSEKTKLSGMRLIISEEVIGDLSLKKYSKNGFDCFIQEYSYGGIQASLFFDRIEKNEEGCPVNLYELIWTESAMSSCTFEYIDQLNSIKSNFNSESIRHFKKTAEIVLKGLLTTDCEKRVQNIFEDRKNVLKAMMK
jgi:hypothetical protein